MPKGLIEEKCCILQSSTESHDSFFKDNGVSILLFLCFYYLYLTFFSYESAACSRILFQGRQVENATFVSWKPTPTGPCMVSNEVEYKFKSLMVSA